MLASMYYTREEAMSFTTFVHKMDRAFTLMHRGSNQELNDLYKTRFILERLSVEEGSSLALSVETASTLQRVCSVLTYSYQFEDHYIETAEWEAHHLQR